MSTNISKTIFDSSPLAFATLDIQPAQQTNQKNLLFNDINPAFEKISKLNKNQLVGKTLHQVFYDPEGPHSDWLQLFKNIPIENEALEFEHYFAALGKWFLVNAFPIDDVRITIALTDITPFKHTKEELIKAKDIADENSANTTAILEGTNDSIWAFDRNYYILYVNNVFQKEFFQAFNIWLDKGTNLLKALPEPLRPMWQERYDTVLANEQFSIVDEVPTPIGTIYIQVTFNPIIKNGVVVGGSCFGSNITERKLAEIEIAKAQKKVEESESRHRQLFTLLRQMADAMPDMIWAKNLKKEYIFCNKAMCSDLLNALDTEEPIGKTDLFFSEREGSSHPENPNWHTFGQLCQDSDKVTLHEMKTMQFDEFGNVKGKFIFLDVQKAPLHDDKGQLIGVVGSARNVTAAKEAENQLRKLSQAVEQSPSSVVITNTSGIIEYVNPKFTKVTGYSLKEAVGKKPNILKSGELSDETYTILWETISSGKEWKGEFHNKKKNGELFWESATISPIKNGKGENINYLAVKEDITERKRWEQELEFSEIRLRANLENTPNVAVQWYDSEGRILYWNSASEILYGWTSKEVMGKTLDQFIYGPEEAEGFLKILKEIEITGVKYGPYESPIHRRDGSSGWIMCTTFSFPLEAGRVGFVCMDVDITERKLAEKQLLIAKEKAEKYNIINEARLKLIQFSESHTIDEILEEALNVAESITESKIGFFHFVEPDQKNLVLQNWSTDTKAHYCKAEGKGLHYPVDKAGVWVDCVKERKPVVHNNYEALEHKKGMPVGHAALTRELVIPIFYDETVKAIFGIGNKQTDYDESDIEIASLISYLAWEIVEKKRIYMALQSAKEKAEESEKKLLEAQEISKMGSWELDIPTGIFTFTDSFFRIFHTTAQAQGSYHITIDDYAKRFVHPDEINLVAEEIKKAIETDNPNFTRYIEHRIMYADGGFGHISVRFFIVKDELGNTIKSYGVNQDITEKKIAEEELLKAKIKAEESDRLKSAFLANMSHEIRTPMNGILGFLELLQNPDLSDQSRDDFIKLVNKSGKRLLDTINDIIEISKIESGQQPVNLAEVNIHDLISYHFKFFRREAEKKGLVLSVNDYVSTKFNFIVTDRHKLDGILTNLIKNAIKFTSEGRIELTAKLENNILVFTIKDTGIGISAERINVIFERFVQADFLAYNRPYEGSGLGLPIVKAYLDMLKGDIWVESTPGIGSTFGFSLPVEIPEVVETSGNKPQLSSLKNFSQLSILVAEDDDISYEYFQLIFEKFKVKLVRAKNGAEAIQLLNKHSIDIVFMDIKMPIVNGIDATKHIRAAGNNVYIIALTAFALPGDREWALNAGCNDYLAKPVSISNFVEALNKYVETKTQ